ncbi:hypothetical protein GF362_00440 [Candidatus Dojkabacteria bacterium]|nr:hypothetical protein [Candidatus Dojkabacteria bacterium]
MITVSEIVKNYIKSTPYIEEALNLDLINVSALAREIQPYVREETMKNIKLGAIIMAIKRYKPEIKKGTNQINKILNNLGDITIKSNLYEFTFQNSSTLISNLKDFILNLNNDPRNYFIISQGIFEITIIVNKKLVDLVSKKFKDENSVFELNAISAISIKLPPDNLNIPGVYYSILKALAWEDVNLIDIVSTSNELILIITEEQIERAFSIIKSLTS